MSIKIMARVWDLSEQQGTALLLMLALADHASDDGVCWPSIERLSMYCRIKERQCQNLLAVLDRTPELHIAHGVGRGKTNLYLLAIGQKPSDLEQIMIQRFGYLKEQAHSIAQGKGALQCTFSEEKMQSGAEKVQSKAEKVQFDPLKGAIAIAPEPLTNTEPSEEPKEFQILPASFRQSPSDPFWARCLEQLRLQMAKSTYETWLAGTTAQRVDGGLVVTTPNPYGADLLNLRLRPLIERTVASVAGEPLAVEFALPQKQSPESITEAERIQ